MMISTETCVITFLKVVFNGIHMPVPIFFFFLVVSHHQHFCIIFTKLSWALEYFLYDYLNIQYRYIKGKN